MSKMAEIERRMDAINIIDQPRQTQMHMEDISFLISEVRRLEADLNASMDAQIQTAKLVAQFEAGRNEAYRALYKVTQRKTSYPPSEDLELILENARAFVDGEEAQ